jgi:hypothetical protein
MADAVGGSVTYSPCVRRARGTTAQTGTHIPRVRRGYGSFGGSGTHLPRVRRPEPPLSTTTPQVIILLGYSGHSRCRGVPHKREIRARTRMGGRRPSHARNMRAHSSGSDRAGPRRARFLVRRPLAVRDFVWSQRCRVRFLSFPAPVVYKNRPFPYTVGHHKVA